jgi:hypothetical protein
LFHQAIPKFEGYWPSRLGAAGLALGERVILSEARDLLSTVILSEAKDLLFELKQQILRYAQDDDDDRIRP